jgi:hypothetical protein
VGVLSVSGPDAAVQNRPSSISVFVKNVGNQDVGGFSVTLEDTTAHVIVGTRSVAGLVAGAATTVTFTWTPATVGNHDLVARQTLSDDRAVNNQASPDSGEAPLIDGRERPACPADRGRWSASTSVANVGNACRKL